jgi:UPF0755 protein
MVRRFLLFLLILVVLAAGFLGANLMLRIGPGRETFVEIAPGTGSRQIAGILRSEGIIRSQYLFDLWHLARGGTLKAGEYRFAEEATLATVYDRIRRGDVYTRTVTIPEGFNLFEIAQAIQNAQLGSEQDFLSAARKDVNLIADLDPKATSLEGYLFPDTYQFQRLQTPAQMLSAMVKRFRETSLQIGLDGDYHRAVTLASIVEKETPIAEDRPLVASVFENRLAIGMPLMTDPTVIYAARLENRYRGAIYQSDLKAESAYNTYRHEGLPPGPICSPGFAALRAAIHPAKTNYLYFVADADASGHSRFSSTLAEHQRNVSAYRNAVKAQAAR